MLILKILVGIVLFFVELVLFNGAMTVLFASSKLEPRGAFHLAQAGFMFAAMIAGIIVYLAWILKR